ncbi:YheC/YheD family protein [Paenibacillus dokdonensis]|uniref:YheC/YheD family protein n=1 Tax=Paenibacillus dokdonensis TaxID=2567944 RepID=A0ABU6GX88_9BACL|nr:YheC/YheD family protein [Paenibacillus dokdonensis]MEC0243893.1 YheC/YheD family protein [Paenibacillus dokdonensis]
MAIQRVSSKWAKTKVLLRNRQITRYIPLTLKYSHDTLIEMLNNHSLVYIKPDIGTYGNGVMCVERLVTPEQSEQDGSPTNPEHYNLQFNTSREEFHNLNDLHSAILRRTQHKLYLIQQGIAKLKYKDRSFDLRVLTQKNTYGSWETTGIIGRVAAKDKIITNYHSGGKIKMLDEVLREHASQEHINALEKDLYNLGVDTARQLQKDYPKLKEIGLDVALDKTLYPWILEVNTLPALFPFKKFFKDKNVYRRIERYAIAYGRLPARRKEVRSKSKA